jgi:FkbM family methyltransferase
MPRLRELLVRSGLFPHARAVRRLFLGRRARAAEEEAIAFYRQMVAPDALAFDLGANVGEITEWLLRARARVVAVEPQPACIAELRTRCARLPGLVDAVPAAVGRARGTATLHVHDVSASSSLRADWFGDPGRATLEVPVVTLADLIARYGVPDYVKVDVEGSEEDVFATLPHPLPLVSFEYVGSALDRAAACMELLTRGRPEEANLALTGPPRFLLSEWVPADELLRRLPGWLAAGTAPRWGDIWVRQTRPPPITPGAEPSAR